MKKLMRCVMVAALLPLTCSVFAAPAEKFVNRAVNISMGSVGGKLDGAALRAVRQLVGFSIASGTVDGFTVNSPKLGAMPIEGGFTACAEAGFGVNKAKFNEFVQDLKAVKPKSGTFYTLETIADCSVSTLVDEPVMCAQDLKMCPDGSAVGRSGSSCEFATCPKPAPKPGVLMCTMEVKMCPDGSAVGRTGRSCEFAPCPVAKR